MRSSDRVRRRGARRAFAMVIGGLVLITAAACEEEPPPESSSPPTTAEGEDVGGETTTTVGGGPTTSEAPTTTTTTVTAPPPEGPSLSRTDTGFTRIRVEVSSTAEWVELRLIGATFALTREVATTGALDVVSLGGDEITTTGVGTAVIDLVLDLRSGGSPVLSMCKNYRGPATVELFRRTDGNVRVASLHNTGTSTHVPPGGCENHVSTTVSRSDLMGPVRWPARRDARPLVLAAYYPWFDDETLGQLAGPDQPTGPTDTSDPAEVRQAVALASSSGIDGFAVAWEGSSRYEPRIDGAFDAADARPGFEIALMLDFAILEHHHGQLTPTLLDRALAAVASHAPRVSQLEVAGRPVVFVYSAERVDRAQWSAALDRLHARTGLRPFVVADAAIGAPGRWDYSTNHFATDNDLSGWVSDRLLKMRLEPAFRDAFAPLWVAPVSPGYDDRQLGRKQPLYVPRDGGSRYDRSWGAAHAALPDWVMVTSWNEYYEQTHVMPGSTTGGTALDQTAARSRTFHTTG